MDLQFGAPESVFEFVQSPMIVCVQIFRLSPLNVHKIAAQRHSYHLIHGAYISFKVFQMTLLIIPGVVNSMG